MTSTCYMRGEDGVLWTSKPSTDDRGKICYFRIEPPRPTCRGTFRKGRKTYLHGLNECTAVAVLRSGKWVAIGTRHGEVAVLKLAENRYIKLSHPCLTEVNSLIFIPGTDSTAEAIVVGGGTTTDYRTKSAGSNTGPAAAQCFSAEAASREDIRCVRSPVLGRNGRGQNKVVAFKDVGGPKRSLRLHQNRSSSSSQEWSNRIKESDAGSQRNPSSSAGERSYVTAGQGNTTVEAPYNKDSAPSVSCCCCSCGCEPVRCDASVCCAYANSALENSSSCCCSCSGCCGYTSSRNCCCTLSSCPPPSSVSCCSCSCMCGSTSEACCNVEASRVPSDTNSSQPGSIPAVTHPGHSAAPLARIARFHSRVRTAECSVLRPSAIPRSIRSRSCDPTRRYRSNSPRRRCRSNAVERDGGSKNVQCYSCSCPTCEGMQGSESVTSHATSYPQACISQETMYPCCNSTVGIPGTSGRPMRSQCGAAESAVTTSFPIAVSPQVKQCGAAASAVPSFFPLGASAQVKPSNAAASPHAGYCRQVSRHSSPGTTYYAHPKCNNIKTSLEPPLRVECATCEACNGDTFVLNAGSGGQSGCSGRLPPNVPVGGHCCYSTASPAGLYEAQLLVAASGRRLFLFSVLRRCCLFISPPKHRAPIKQLSPLSSVPTSLAAASGFLIAVGLCLRTHKGVIYAFALSHAHSSSYQDVCNTLTHQSTCVHWHGSAEDKTKWPASANKAVRRRNVAPATASEDGLTLCPPRMIDKEGVPAYISGAEAMPPCPSNGRIPVFAGPFQSPNRIVTSNAGSCSARSCPEAVKHDAETTKPEVAVMHDAVAAQAGNLAGDLQEAVSNPLLSYGNYTIGTRSGLPQLLVAETSSPIVQVKALQVCGVPGCTPNGTPCAAIPNTSVGNYPSTAYVAARYDPAAANRAWHTRKEAQGGASCNGITCSTPTSSPSKPWLFMRQRDAVGVVLEEGVFAVVGVPHMREILRLGDEGRRVVRFDTDGRNNYASSAASAVHLGSAAVAPRAAVSQLVFKPLFWWPAPLRYVFLLFSDGNILMVDFFRSFSYAEKDKTARAERGASLALLWPALPQCPTPLFLWKSVASCASDSPPTVDASSTALENAFPSTSTCPGGAHKHASGTELSRCLYNCTILTDEPSCAMQQREHQQQHQDHKSLRFTCLNTLSHTASDTRQSDQPCQQLQGPRAKLGPPRQHPHCSPYPRSTACDDIHERQTLSAGNSGGIFEPPDTFQKNPGLEAMPPPPPSSCAALLLALEPSMNRHHSLMSLNRQVAAHASASGARANTDPMPTAHAVPLPGGAVENVSETSPVLKSPSRCSCVTTSLQPIANSSLLMQKAEAGGGTAVLTEPDALSAGGPPCEHGFPHHHVCTSPPSFCTAAVVQGNQKKQMEHSECDNLQRHAEQVLLVGDVPCNSIMTRGETAAGTRSLCTAPTAGCCASLDRHSNGAASTASRSAGHRSESAVASIAAAVAAAKTAAELASSGSVDRSTPPTAACFTAATRLNASNRRSVGTENSQRTTGARSRASAASVLSSPPFIATSATSVVAPSASGPVSVPEFPNICSVRPVYTLPVSHGQCTLHGATAEAGTGDLHPTGWWASDGDAERCGLGVRRFEERRCCRMHFDSRRSACAATMQQHCRGQETACRHTFEHCTSFTSTEGATLESSAVVSSSNDSISSTSFSEAAEATTAVPAAPSASGLPWSSSDITGVLEETVTQFTSGTSILI